MCRKVQRSEGKPLEPSQDTRADVWNFAKQLAYFEAFGKIVLRHEFAADFATTGRMIFIVRFINEGNEELLLRLNTCWFKNSFKFFVGETAVNPVGVLPPINELIFIEPPPAGYYEIEVDTFLTNGDVWFPNCAAFDVQGRPFEVEFTYIRVASNRIAVSM